MIFNGIKDLTIILLCHSVTIFGTKQPPYLELFSGEIGKFLINARTSLYGPKIQDPSEDRDIEEYDFIIIGAGTAGSILANRLTEVPDWKVLLLESGDPENLIGEIPQLSPLLQLTQYNWRYQTIPQKTGCLGMIDNKCNVAAGKGLGGSGTLSNGIFVRGSQKDYDLWAKHVQKKDWNYENILRYHRKAEDVHLRTFDWEHHGLGGPNYVEDLRNPSRVRKPFLNAAKELNFTILDYNGENQIGFSRTQVANKRGRKHSISRAYLESIKDRKNLVIKTLSNVTKIVINPNTKEAEGVEYTRNGRMFLARNKKEIVLSAGALNSPQLLMISGIGPKHHLNEMNIDCIADLPVGDNLRDHVAFFGLNFLYKDKSPEENDLLNFYDWFVKGEGPLTSCGIDAIGLLSSTLSEDPTYPDYELGLVPINPAQGYDLMGAITNFKREVYDSIWKEVEDKNGFVLIIILTRAKSSGFVRLRSKKIEDHPIIDPQYLSDPNDIEIILEGIKKGLQLTETQSFRRVGIELNTRKVYGCENFSVGTEEYWRCAIPKLQMSIFHYSGTNKMGTEDDPRSVVNDRFGVKGVKNLRVVDASVVPNANSGHMLGPVIMLGEKAGDIIKEDWNQFLS